MYEKWFATDKRVVKQSWTYWLQKPEHIRCMAQIRLGSHWVKVQQGRCARPKQRRGERVCTCCRGQVEDEWHVLHCPTQVWRRALGQIPQLLSDNDFKAFMNTRDEVGWYRLAEFLVHCKQAKLNT